MLTASRLLSEFNMDLLSLQTVAHTFCTHLEKARNSAPSSLRLIPSYLPRPTGAEQGRFLALDFGGTNLRFSLVELLGHGHGRIAHQLQFPLRGAAYDLTTSQTTVADLFAAALQQLSACPWLPRQPLFLGHTFSYPTRQTGPNAAVLLHWTKEIAIRGFSGQDINTLLGQALHDCRLAYIRPVAILNDTVATLLAAAYAHPDADMGAICGTGHNMACIDPLTLDPAALLVNLESGAFDGLCPTPWDDRLTAATSDPAGQRLEKMVAGHYLGELARLLIVDLLHIPPAATTPYSLTTTAINQWLLPAGSTSLQHWVATHAPHYAAAPEATAAVKDLATAVLRRAGQLVAAAGIGIQWAIDPQRSRCHVLSVDGSLFFSSPVFAAALASTARTLDPDRPLSITGIRDGSSIGAAIAAALVSA